MSLVSNLLDLARRAGQQCKLLGDNIGVLANLTTEEKANLVAALNSLVTVVNTVSNKADANATDIDALESAVSNLQVAVQLIDDTTESTAKTYSSSKIASEIVAAKQAVKDDLLGGAGEAYDTLKELADLISSNQTAIQALQTIAAGHVKYTEAQELTDPQKEQARTNIGAASAVAHNTLSNNVGDTTADFVAAFESALAGTDE